MDNKIDGIVNCTVQTQNKFGRTLLLIGLISLSLFLLSVKQNIYYTNSIVSTRMYQTFLIEARQLNELQLALQKQYPNVAKFTARLRQYEDLEEAAREKATHSCGRCEEASSANEHKVLELNRTSMIAIWIRQLERDPVETMDFHVAARALHGLRDPDDPTWGDRPNPTNDSMGAELEVAARYVESDIKIPSDGSAYSLIRELQSEGHGADEQEILSDGRLNQLQLALRTLANYCEFSGLASCDRQAVDASLAERSGELPTYKTPLLDVAFDAKVLIVMVPLAFIPLQVFCLVLLVRLSGLHRLGVRAGLDRHNVWNFFDPISHRYHDPNLYSRGQRFVLKLGIIFPVLLSISPVYAAGAAALTSRDSIRWSKIPLDALLSKYSQSYMPWGVLGAIAVLSICLMAFQIRMADKPKDHKRPLGR